MNTPAISDAPALVPAAPTFEEQVAGVDARAVANDILARGRREAMQVPMIAIVAMAAWLERLARVADLTAAMFDTFDKLDAEPEKYRRIALASAAQAQVELVGAALESLGYGRDGTSHQTTTQETTNGQER